MTEFNIKKFLKYTLSFILFYKILNYFRNTFLKPVFYDIFFSNERKAVCIIAPYYSFAGAKKLTCVCDFQGLKIILEPSIVDDSDRNCLIVLFKLPSNVSGRFIYEIMNRRLRISVGEGIFMESSNRKYKVSISTLFKYEIPFLKEWIDHHLSIGVEHFYLYENNYLADKNISDILDPYIKKGLITHILWPFPYNFYNYKVKKLWPNDSYSYTQISQINHAIYKFGDESEWILNCDVDEYFYSPRKQNILDVVNTLSQNGDIASIRISGIWFGGTREETARVRKDGVKKTFIYSEERPTANFKCIFNTESVMVASVHNSLSQVKKEINVSFDLFRFNHYRGLGWKRRVDEDFAHNVKNTEILFS